MPQVAPQHTIAQQRRESRGHACSVLRYVEQGDRLPDQLVEPVTVRARGQFVGEQDGAGVGAIESRPEINP